MELNVPAVTCTSCERTWNSAAMAEGLRLLGACPRCSGSLSFAGDQSGAAPERTERPDRAALAPHLVLGIPRR